MRTLFGLLLSLHGVIHVLCVVPRPPGADDWPFTLERSWLLPGADPAVLKPLGFLLAVVAIAFLAAAGLGALGLPLVSGMWQALAVIGSVASLLVLGLFWHPSAVFGVLISVAVLVLVLWASWPPAVFAAE